MAEDNTAKDFFEMFQKMWNPMSLPMPGVFQPTMEPAEVEKKISELLAVENWLKLNLSYLQMTIKTLEMQKSALQTLKESAQKPDNKG
jgi:hypothetical protein